MTGIKRKAIHNLIFILVAVLLIGPFPPAGTVYAVDDGIGTKEDPYRISDSTDLYNICNEWVNSENTHYVLDNDIDLNDINRDPLCSMEEPFLGFLDGRGHTIENLLIDIPADNIGLFAALGSGAKVHHLRVNNTNVTGKSYVGALAGSAEGAELSSIEAVNVTVTGGNDPGDESIGGIIGKANDTKMIHVYLEGTVTGYGQSGGLVGIGEESGIYNSSFSGVIEIERFRAGGLAGEWYGGEVISSFSKGVFQGENGNYIGGLIGYAISNSSGFSAIRMVDNYADHKFIEMDTTVRPGYFYGGLIARMNGSERGFSNNFWNADKITNNDDSGIGKTAAQLRDPGTFDDWKEDDWRLEAGNYPLLQPNTYLQSLETNVGDLIQTDNTEGFFFTETNYSVTLPEDEPDFYVIPTVYHMNATVTTNVYNTVTGNVYGTVEAGQPSMTFSFDKGETKTVSIVVYGEEDGVTSERTYDLKVKREPSSDATLSALEISNGQLDPLFDPDILEYSATVTQDVYAIRLTPTVNELPAAIIMNGEIIASGTESPVIDLVAGVNPIYIRVVAGNGTLNEYVVNVTRPRAPSESTPDMTIPIIVNGEIVDHSAKAVVSHNRGRKTTTITIDENKMNERLQQEEDSKLITVPVMDDSITVITELNAQMVKNMQEKSAILKIETKYASYTLPTNEILIDAISEAVGSEINLKDIIIHIEMAVSSEETTSTITSIAQDSGFTMIGTSIDFHIKATYDDNIVEVSRFNNYVERTITLPEGVNPEKITTAVVLNKDGTVLHIPTKVIEVEGWLYAQINSLTNSTYTVIYNHKEFEDAKNHWAKEDINGLASRMVLNGIGNDLFNPNVDITRAEFAAILIRGLGLTEGKEDSTPFEDVKTTDWNSGVIQTAFEYDLITGFGDGTFKPAENITREQAMTIISRAMQITGLKEDISIQDTERLFAPFTDAYDIAEWAKSDVTDNLQAGIINGRTNNQLALKAHITRAEVAAMMKRLLQQSDLI